MSDYRALIGKENCFSTRVLKCLNVLSASDLGVRGNIQQYYVNTSTKKI